MMVTKDTAYKKIAELIERFEEQFTSYKKAEYNETLTRRDFIDPFFKALGWDMDNENGYAESYREVIHEDKVKVGGVTKAPDYSFRLVGGKRLFFVEAKKPMVVVKEEIQPAYQIRRYGWSAKLPISIMTDFEEFAIYDCTKKPSPTDKASVGRLKYLTFREYLIEFDFLWDTFSKERVLKGSFDKFVKSDTHKKGTATVDKEFLLSLDKWRTYLATSISLNNKQLDEEEINFVVQQTLDRIIFLRIAEDRGVEPYGNLQQTLKQGKFYNNLFLLFKDADDKYNSGLFDFKKDRISKTLEIENKIIKTIISQLYFPESPYEFSVLSVEILGSAYEQFLGKQIRIDSAHRARIEEKPEVRKAGGVYYTPQYIVDYIVKNTVGKKVEGKTPEQVSQLKILDPACGSGSFLLGAYQYLLDWHKNYYTENGKLTKSKKDSLLTPEGSLTTAEKKRILLNNIYGVDIDLNAVEVTKLSLLLKCLEGETQASISHQMSMFNERVLPTLDENIKDGNSLVDIDFYSGELDFNEEKKVKPFNWQKSFPSVFQRGGFDVVLGNPPYIRIQSIAENSPSQGKYFNTRFKSAKKGNYDIFVIFIEKGLELIKSHGKIGFILPHKFFTAQYGEGIRELILKNKVIEKIIHFGHLQIFDNATTYTCILLLTKETSNNSFNFYKIDDLQQWKSSNENEYYRINYSELNNQEWNFIGGTEKLLFDKLITCGINLENVTERIFQGLKTGADSVFILKKLNENRNNFQVYSAGLSQEIELEKEILHPLIKGGNSSKYIFTNPEYLILFPYELNGKEKVELINQNKFKNKYPLAFEYLSKCRKLLISRDHGKLNSNFWYGFSRNQALDIISTPKIFTPDISLNANYSIDQVGNIYFTGGVSGGYGIIPQIGVSKFYLLGLLNSKLLDWLLKKLSTQMKGGWYSFEAKYIKKLPIILTNNVRFIKEIESNVEILILLSKERIDVKLQSKLDQFQSKISYCESRINEIVYQIYKLTSEEIQIIERANEQTRQA